MVWKGRLGICKEKDTEMVWPRESDVKDHVAKMAYESNAKDAVLSDNEHNNKIPYTKEHNFRNR